MAATIELDGDSCRIDRDGTHIELLRAEIRGVSVHAVDTIVDGIVRYITLDHEAGHYLEWPERDDIWKLLVDTLPRFLGFDRAALERALESAAPDEEPIVVVER